MKRITMGLLALLAAAGVLAAPVHAETPDQQYLRILQSGLDTADYKPEPAIVIAHKICERLQAGQSDYKVAKWLHERTQLDSYELGWVIGAAQTAYCPDS